MNLPNAIAAAIAAAAPSLAQDSIQHTYVETSTVTRTNAASPSSFFVSTPSAIPYPDVSPSATVRPISINVFSSWTYDWVMRYENQTSSVIDTYSTSEGTDAAMIFGDQNGIGTGCDSFYVQSGGSPVSLQPLDVFEETRQIEFRDCQAASSSLATSSFGAAVWAMMLDHLTNKRAPFFHSGQLELFPSTELGMVTSASMSMTQDTTMTVVVELDEINPVVSPQCGSGPNGVGPGADLRLYGSLEAVSNNLVARVDGLTPDSFAVLVATDGSSSAPMGIYNICLAGNRLAQEVRFATDTVEDFEVDLSNVMPGTTVAFQALYRVGGSFGVSSLRVETVQ